MGPFKGYLHRMEGGWTGRGANVIFSDIGALRRPFLIYSITGKMWDR